MLPRLIGRKTELRAPSLDKQEIIQLVDFNQDKEVLMWTGRNDYISTIENCEEWVKKCMSDENDRLFFIYEQAHDNLIGSCNMTYKDSHSSNAELGILLGIKYVNKGYGTEVIKLLLEFAFNEMHVHRVMLKADAANTRAIHVYEKCRFSQCGLEHETNWTRGEWHDTIIMEILDRDYYS